MKQRLGLRLHSLLFLDVLCFGASSGSLSVLPLLLLKRDKLDLFAQIQHVAVWECQVKEAVLQLSTGG